MNNYDRLNEQAALAYINQIRGLFLAQIIEGLESALTPEDTLETVLDALAMSLDDYMEYIK